MFIMARFVAFISDFYAALLSLMTIFDQDLLLGGEITGEDNDPLFGGLAPVEPRNDFRKDRKLRSRGVALESGGTCALQTKRVALRTSRTEYVEVVVTTCDVHH